MTDLRACGEGFAYAAADPAFGLVNASGSVERLQGPRTFDFRGVIGNELAISSDGVMVRFVLGVGDDKRVLFDVRAGSLADSTDASVRLAPARIDGLPVTDWENGTAPKFKGVKIGPRELRKGSLARGSARRVRLRFGDRLVCPRFRLGGQADVATAGSGHSPRRRLQRGRADSCRRL